MPHLTVEYTDNIKADANIPELLEKLAKLLGSKTPLFPIGGIRVRAIELKDYFIADGAEDDAFIHATLKIGAGRSEEEKTKTCDELFSIIQSHFAKLYSKHYLALSMELYEFSEAGTYKQNNIHSRFKK